MCGIQYTITMHAQQQQENTTHNEEKNHSVKINLELIQMLELVNKDNKTIIMPVFHMFKSLYRDMDGVKIMQIKLLDM